MNAKENNVITPKEDASFNLGDWKHRDRNL